MPCPPKSDHRPRVGEQRRARMRRRLVESAMRVFAQKGVGASVIEDVIADAGVSRGTFYNYFASNDDLLAAAKEELGRDLVDVAETRVMQVAGGANRLAVGALLFLGVARDCPLFGRFMARVGLQATGPGGLIHRYMPTHIQDGVTEGDFLPMPLPVALDLIAGAAIAGVERMMRGDAGPDHPAQIVAAILRGLGMAPGDAARIAFQPVAPLSPAQDSLLASKAMTDPA
jgi:AcrR family transcriptional regulator